MDFFPKISRGWTFHSAFKETLRLCATPQRVDAFSINGVIRPCTFLFYSISFFLFFFFCLSRNNRQVTVISTLLHAIANLCFAWSPRAKGSNFRTCAIAACPGFRDSPLMRMSMNRTLPDLPFACPGRSGYEIRASVVEGMRHRSVTLSHVLGISMDGNGFYLSQRQWNVDGDDFWEALNGKWLHWNKKLSTYCVKAVLFYLLPKHVFLRSKICKACRFKFFRHRRFLGTTISIVKLKRHLIMYFCHVSPLQSDSEANVFTSTFA